MADITGMTPNDQFIADLKMDDLDSLSLVEYTIHIEEEFGVHVSDCEISEDNLGSLRAVARFVASKQPFAVG